PAAARLDLGDSGGLGDVGGGGARAGAVPAAGPAGRLPLGGTPGGLARRAACAAVAFRRRATLRLLRGGTGSRAENDRDLRLLPLARQKAGQEPLRRIPRRGSGSQDEEEEQGNVSGDRDQHRPFERELLLPLFDDLEHANRLREKCP